MPLPKGPSDKTRNANIKELMDTYNETGKIGNTKPQNKAKARAIAAAIAYKIQREARS